jgi:hypothetical protein
MTRAAEPNSDKRFIDKSFVTIWLNVTHRDSAMMRDVPQQWEIITGRGRALVNK